jgi:hypothetical protein
MAFSSKEKDIVSLLSTVVIADVAANQVNTFEHIVPINLSSMFTGYGPLPAVTATQNQVGHWNAAGQARTVLLSDGSSTQELLTKYEHPKYFSYTISDFTGIIRFLAISANGDWFFSSDARGKTSIKWRYTFNAKSVLVVPILWVITKILWRGYMQKALSIAVAQVESKVTQFS